MLAGAEPSLHRRLSRQIQGKRVSAEWARRSSQSVLGVKFISVVFVVELWLWGRASRGTVRDVGGQAEVYRC